METWLLTEGNVLPPHPETYQTGPKTNKTPKYRQRAVCLHVQSPPQNYRGIEVMT